MSNVKIWEEKVVIPTYEVYPPDKNPRFYEKRAYQGSSGKVYPLPVTEKINDKKVNKEYQGVFLENDYLKIMILPELGGRIQRALDKTNNYDFVYYNHVIKPALVGLTGPWISGGIEFNWPQHHRPSTFSPTEYKLQENKDGSKSVLVSETDKMYGTKGMGTFTLYPDKAFIEIKGQLYNPTDLPQTFLWWANPAVPVNDYTTSVFPPDVHAVMDHGKRAVSTFPIATGEYYKMDYSKGVDISKYKNVPVPTSYMAEKSDYDFIGNYDENLKAGLLHVADHHVSPGKKQWTWGNGDFGQAWDANLTDEDGPYIELMTGVFTDNQPDFTWLRPYEEKVFTQYFMPYKGVGYIKNATVNGAVNLEKNQQQGKVAVYVTSHYDNLKIKVFQNDKVIFETVETLDPSTYYQGEFFIPEDGLLTIEVTTEDEQSIVAYEELAKGEVEIPEPAEAIPAPEKLKTTEELFLAATHLEQYRHATSEPEDYYLEGLKRDATDIRLNTGYGSLLYRQGNFSQSEKYLRKAFKKQTWKTPNPYYGEPSFQLGLSLEIQNKNKEAYDCFYKATWNDDTQGAAFFKLAAIMCRKNSFAQAKEFIERSLIKNTHHMKGRVLDILIGEKLGEDVSKKIKKALEIDPLDLTLNYLRSLREKNNDYVKIFRGDLQNYLIVALDYLQGGFYIEALSLLEECPVDSPMIYYYQGYVYTLLNENKKAVSVIKEGEKASSDYCFPNRLEEIIILENVIKIYPEAFYAKYYLGNLFYDKKQYDKAMILWEQAGEGLKDFPTVFRNLSIAYYNKKQEKQQALEFINRAFQLDKSDSRVLLEKTQLEKLLNYPIQKRLEELEENIAVTTKRDDLLIEYLTLLNLANQPEKVMTYLNERIFHPWEGGEGKVSAQYVTALIKLGKKAQESKQAQEFFQKALTYPRNLGEGKLPSNHSNAVEFYLGEIFRKSGDLSEARKHFLEATKGITSPESVLYYNDEPGDILFYQGLSLEKLGEKEKAKRKFNTLVDYGKKHLNDEITYDFFAVSAPAHSVYENDIQLDNYIYCKYLTGLGYLGNEEYSKALDYFIDVLKLNPAHEGVNEHLSFAKEKAKPTWK